MTDRIETIREMLARQGEDVFLRYSLGMEYASAGDNEAAIAEFARCIEVDGAYLAAYVEMGKAMCAVGRLDEARATFAKVLSVAEGAGQTHMRDFIQQQLESLGGGRSG